MWAEARRYSALMLAALMIGHHLLISALGFPSASLPGSSAAAVQGCTRPGITMGARIRHKSASAHHSFAGTVRK
jgi:hypothetical protein